MEEPGGTAAEAVTPSSAGASKSKALKNLASTYVDLTFRLDTLSKDHLIKYAKKQIAAMQKMKSKCLDLEKEVESLKQQQSKTSDNNSKDTALFQELTERMDALLLEKAETQQNVALLRKELEKNKQQAKDDLVALQSEHERVMEDNQRMIKNLESSIQEANSKHLEEVALFQNLLKEREDSDREKESEKEKQRQADYAVEKERAEKERRDLEAQLEKLKAELENIQEKHSLELSKIQKNYQRDLTEVQQEVENLKEELSQKSLHHEEEMRSLEEDFELERERLLLLHEELTEQLALKDSYLQDVQEEDEEPHRGSGIAKMLELSKRTQADCSADGEDTESSRLAAALDDLQSQNTMLKDELTLLSNLKGELEAELERAKEEFQVEREELEFKINELQLTKDSPSTEPTVTLDLHHQHEEMKESTVGLTQDHSSLKLEEQQNLNLELRTQCEALIRERDSALTECQHVKNILQGIETELSEKTKDFVLQYQAMKEQGASTVQELQDTIEKLTQERDKGLAKTTAVIEEKNALMKDIQDLKQKLECPPVENQELQSSGEQQTTLACKPKQSVNDFQQNEEILSQLEMKENTIQDLKDLVNMLKEERDKIQNLLNLKEEEMRDLTKERTKAMEKLEQEKDKEILMLREEKENELKSLKTETQEKVKQQEEVKESLKEELVNKEEMLSNLEAAIKEMSAEKSRLHQKLEDALEELSNAQKEKELQGSKLSALEVQLEREASEKQELEEKLKSVTEDAAQSIMSMQALEENHSQILQNSTDEVEGLRARVGELEQERNLLKNSLEEAQKEHKAEEMQTDLQAHIRDLEKERDMLKGNLEEVVNDVEGLQKDLQEMKKLNENISEENQKSQADVSQLNEAKMELEKMMENLEKESKELRDQLTEKDSLISQLRGEVAALQESAVQSPSSEENTSEITDRLALLQKEIKEKAERMNKIKAVALKTKKELDINKKEVLTLKEEVESLKAEREKVNSSMKDIIHSAEGYKNLQIDYDKQTEQLDLQREKVETAERQIAELTKQLSSAVTQRQTLSSEKEDLNACLETVRGTVRQLETKNQELQKQLASLDRDLLAERAMKEQKLKDLASVTKEVEELTAQLRKQQEQSQQTAQELEQLRKEAQQNSLLDMEMADYERLVKELNGKLADKDEHVKDLKDQINTLTQKQEAFKKEIETLKSQVDNEEEKCSKMKQLLVKTKKDLADAKKQESSLMMQQASLKGELEANQQQFENSKIEICELTADRHHLQEQLRSALEQQQRTSNSLQQRIHSLQQDRDAAKAELLATTTEFDGYKVRVHNVLKQQKNKASAQSEGDAFKLEREQLSSQIEQLRIRLSESQQTLQSTTAELQQLQTEHDTLLDRHNKILQENVSKEAELRERLLSLQSENVALRSDLSQAQADLSSQVETQRQTYRDQLRKLQDDHRATVETLQRQLTRVEEQLFTLQSQNSSLLVQSSRKTVGTDLQRRNGDQIQTGMGMVATGDLQSMAREEGEGMETTETEKSSPAQTSLPSLEQLLKSPDPKQEPFVWTVEPTKEELTEKLNTATRSMDHMNSLLHETEATNAILMEQITLLKSEMRRLERNQEREKSVANLEYLKNVLLQFIFLRSGSERQALLPVIHTMLQLSPEEKSKLAAIAQGEEERSASRSSGWSSYLHSWSGIR